MRFVHNTGVEDDDEIFEDDNCQDHAAAKTTRSSTEDGENFDDRSATGRWRTTKFRLTNIRNARKTNNV